MIKPLLVWRNPDSTQDINAVSSLLNKGIYDGGILTPSSANLNVSIAPFWAKSTGGLTVYSDAAETVTLTPGTTQYLVLFAKYGIPTSTVEFQLVSEVTWSTSPNKDYFITFAKIVTPALATLATAATFVYDNADYTEKLGKASWRPAVANAAALPTTGNRKGDLRLTLDTYTIYVWDTATVTWSPYGQATNLSETSARGSMESQWERLSLSTSGLIGSVLNDASAHASTPTFPGISFPIAETGVPATLDVGAVHAYVHGLYIHEKSQRVTLPAAPGVGSRYDLVFLEVYREVIPAASGVNYDYSGGGTGNLAAVIAHLESGADSTFGPNYRVSSIDLVDSTTVVITRSSLRVQSGVPADTVNPVSAMTASVNVAANTYAQFTTSDVFAYRAAYASAHGGYTYAIPLLLLKRVSTEGTFTVFDGTTGARYAFDLSPSATVGKALTDTIATVGGASASLAALPRPSGYLKGTDLLITRNTSGPGICAIDVPDAIVRVKNTVLRVAGGNVRMPVAPVAAGRRDLAFLEVRNTWSADSGYTKLGGESVHTMPALGARACAWYGKFLGASVGSATDSDDSMTALGYVNVAGDTGLWRRAAGADEPTVDGYVYAFPMAVIHRRNSGAYSVNANPNGSLSRPDGSSLADPEWIHEREIVDLRRAVVKAADVPSIVEKTFADVTTASLRTRLRQHPYAADVYGTSCLMTTTTSAAPIAGTHTMTPVPSASNAHSVWSDSDELIPLSFKVVNLNVAQTSADNVFSWNGGGNTGTLTVTAPAGMYIMTANSNLVGPYTNQYVHTSTTNYISRSFALQFDHTNDAIFNAASAVGVTITISATAYDAINNVTAVTATSNGWGSKLTSLVNGSLILTAWFVKPRAKLHSTYATNGALFGSPTRTYSATHGGSPVNVGAITATIRKVVTGTNIVITQADVFAARPDIATAAGSVRLYGVARIHSQGAVSTLRYVRLQNSAGTDVGTARMSIDLVTALPASTNVDITVMCDGDLIYQWVEVVPESRQLRGLYSYGLSTGTYADVGSQSGYSAYPLDRNSFQYATDRMAPMSETSIGANYGYKSGRAATSNAPRATDILATNAPVSPDYVDFMMAAYALSGGPVQPAGVGHIFWYRSADANGVGVNVPSTMLPGLRTVSAVTSYTGQVPLDYTLPHHGPYGPRVMAGDFTSPKDPITFLTVIYRAPTAALSLVYETPAYQGLTDDAVLRSRLRGRLQHLADSIITTEGSNAAFTHQAIARLPPAMHQCLWHEASGTYIAHIASTHRHPTDVVMDVGGVGSTGTVVADVRARARNRVSLMRQLPYPSAPTTTYARDYADASEMSHSVVSKRSLVRNQVGHLAGSAARGDTQASPFTVVKSSLLMTNGTTYRVPLSLPPGAILQSIMVTAFNDAVPATLTVDLMAATEGGAYDAFRIARGTVSLTTGTGPTQTYLSPSADGVTGGVRFDSQVLNGNAMFHLEITTSAASTILAGIDVSYVARTDTMNPGYPTRTVYRALGLENLVVADRAMNPQSSLSSSNAGLGKLQGQILTIPSTWSGADDTAATAAVFTSGAVDTAGEWARGVTARGTDAATTYYERGMLAYVPYSGTVVRSAQSSALANLNLEMPPVPNVGTDYVAFDFSSNTRALARVTPYAITNTAADVTVGIAVATKSFGVVAPTSGFDIPEGGSTIDGFYPQGRPILEGE